MFYLKASTKKKENHITYVSNDFFVSDEDTMEKPENGNENQDPIPKLVGKRNADGRIRLLRKSSEGRIRMISQVLPFLFSLAKARIERPMAKVEYKS
jgi:hypothetical protein